MRFEVILAPFLRKIQCRANATAARLGAVGSFHIEADTPTGSVAAFTTKNAVKTWGTLDAAARWVRGLGVGTAQIDLTHWQPGQKALRV